MRDPVMAWIGLGGNLGEAREAVERAIEALDRLPETRLVTRSSLWRSAPVDAQGPDFINAVAQVATRLPAPVLLRHLQRLELEAGRERPYRNAPRTLDLDLLLFGSGRVESAELTVPHPRMFERAFVLMPLAEIAPGMVEGWQLDGVRRQRIEMLSGHRCARPAVPSPRPSPARGRG